MSDDYYGALPIGFLLHEYRIDAVLGQGGFGITYRANDTNLNKRVAIKEYLPESFCIRDDDFRIQPKSGSDDDFNWGLSRFEQEAQTLAQFEHPHIVPVLRYFNANNTAYMVMAYQDGQSLGEILDVHETLEETELEEILHPLLDGLALVHHAKILHRDIKPDNIFIRLADGAPVLLDFGAARQAIGERNRRVTRIVTPNYAPEEQYYSGGKMGPWTDIYALASVVYEGIAGEPPPEAPGRVKNDDFRPAAEVGAGRYRPEFLAAIDWALAVQPEDRPQSVAEFKAALPEPLNAELAAAVKRAGLAAAPVGKRKTGTKLAAAAREVRTKSEKLAAPRGAQPAPQPTRAQPAARPSGAAAAQPTPAAPGVTRRQEDSSVSTPQATARLPQDRAADGGKRRNRAATGARWVAISIIVLVLGGATALAVTLFGSDTEPVTSAPIDGNPADKKDVAAAPTDPPTADPNAKKTDPDKTDPDKTDPDKPEGEKTEDEKRKEALAKAQARRRAIAARQAALARARDGRLRLLFRNRRLTTRLPGRSDATLLKFNASGAVSAVTIESERSGAQISEAGRWWVQKNRICVKLSQWNRGQASCFAIQARGRWNSPRVGVVGSSAVGRFSGTLSY